MSASCRKWALSISPCMLRLIHFYRAWLLCCCCCSISRLNSIHQEIFSLTLISQQTTLAVVLYSTVQYIRELPQTAFFYRQVLCKIRKFCCHHKEFLVVVLVRGDKTMKSDEHESKICYKLSPN